MKVVLKKLFFINQPNYLTVPESILLIKPG